VTGREYCDWILRRHFEHSFGAHTSGFFLHEYITYYRIPSDPSLRQQAEQIVETRLRQDWLGRVPVWMRAPEKKAQAYGVQGSRHHQVSGDPHAREL
jgi:hypothetical protein